MESGIPLKPVLGVGVGVGGIVALPLVLMNRLNKTQSVFLNSVGSLFFLKDLFSQIIYLFVWLDALRPNQQLWSCQDDQFA